MRAPSTAKQKVNMIGELLQRNYSTLQSQRITWIDMEGYVDLQLFDFIGVLLSCHLTETFGF